jgi:hypothetical protein
VHQYARLFGVCVGLSRPLPDQAAIEKARECTDMHRAKGEGVRMAVLLVAGAQRSAAIGAVSFCAENKTSLKFRLSLSASSPFAALAASHLHRIMCVVTDSTVQVQVKSCAGAEARSTASRSTASFYLVLSSPGGRWSGLWLVVGRFAAHLR